MRTKSFRVVELISMVLLGAVILLPSTGCILLAVGAGGAAGYQVAKDDRTIGTKLDDAGISTSVKAELIGDFDVPARNIDVDTFDGVVSLYGKVPSREIARKAVALAKKVKGVKRVKSHLTIQDN